MSEQFFRKQTFKIYLLILPLVLSNQISFGNDEVNYSGPGDDKNGYDSRDYTTNSLSLEDRKGKKADIIKYVTIKQ